MGWTSGWYSRKEMIDHVTKPWVTDTQATEVIAKKFYGNHLWCVFERTFPRVVGDRQSERFIVLFLMQRFGKGDWGYKDMSEDMGPYFYSCPLSFLDMTPDPREGKPSEYGFNGCSTWREAVHNWHARRNQKIEVGQIVKLTNGEEYRITEVGRMIRAVGVKDGRAYRIPRSMLTLSRKEDACEQSVSPSVK